MSLIDLVSTMDLKINSQKSLELLTCDRYSSSDKRFIKASSDSYTNNSCTSLKWPKLNLIPFKIVTFYKSGRRAVGVVLTILNTTNQDFSFIDKFPVIVIKLVTFSITRFCINFPLNFFTKENSYKTSTNKFNETSMLSLF